MSDLAREIERLLPPEDRLLDPADCWAYGADNSRLHAAPEAVAFARDSQTVVELVRLCRRLGAPLVARGRGTGTTGAAVPDRGGLVLSLERMNRIVDVDPANRWLIAEPGVTNAEIQAAAGEHGFFWPPDPTSAAYCTLGGNLAYNSAGPHAVKYGTPRDNTLGLEAVAGTGEHFRTGVRTNKGVVGYDLTRLLIGSEGTLGIITQATLKLTPRPECTRLLQAVYPTIDAAARAVARLMARAESPSALEFMDRSAIGMIRGYGGVELPEAAGAILMIESDGPAEIIETRTDGIRRTAAEGALSVDVADTPEAMDRLWQVRKALSPALRTIAPKKINEDVVVPVSRIPALIRGLEELAERHAIRIVNFGHAGNGNIHVNLLVNPDDPEEMQRAEVCLDEVFRLVLSLDGSLSGEHGVGLVKRPFVDRELDPAALTLMEGVRAVFDPDGILNPGKAPPAP
ncbi:FAD-binding oxidoreductase [Thioalkalivibrio halophilus]|uniref:FAD-binding oxidoreductase n=1 Tax=Thioalkalivibrio halophilus TaxID=252474 RepID=A0A1V2ZVP5_9GAMM|nr:FAD-linked oxidase C-terminal domain-containing protein [Thioalkalivibrio halophilus]OOC09188.1 FAD-binding oxidoreductase [Thioalkalivibrio halophilus]